MGHQKLSPARKRLRIALSLVVMCVASYALAPLAVYGYVTWKFERLRVGQPKVTIDSELRFFTCSVDALTSLPPGLRACVRMDGGWRLYRYTLKMSSESFHIVCDDRGIVRQKLPTFE